VKSRTFVDQVTLHAIAGDGGNGCVAFRREKYVPRGGPSGGDGGRGGHVILQGDRDVASLIGLYYQPHQRADNGGHGQGKNLHGRNGRDRIVKIPCGTEVRRAGDGALLADILAHEQTFRAARGGKGGLGNTHWKSATHQAPREHTDGEPGEQAELRLTLKLLADVGLVGFPNAGKSSLLSVLSDAHPKVGAYPFTTLNPVIGTVIFEDYSRLTVADIPGLIEGAHDGVGLGHDFLRHIERAAALVFVIDMGAVDGREPADDYRKLREELRLHREDLDRRPSIVVANKMDLPAARDNLAAFQRETGADPMAVSAIARQGLDALRSALRRQVAPSDR